MENKLLQIKACKADFLRNDIVLAAMVEHENDLKVAVGFRYEKCKKFQYVKPFVTLSIEQAQILMDSLWVCGVRPTEGSGSAGSLAATEKHLADMRSIVFNRLKVNKP
jgi:hypothetical protein